MARIDRPLRVYFGHTPFLIRVWQEAKSPDDEDAAAAYAQALSKELSPLVEEGYVETQEQYLGAGGPGVDFDWVELVVSGLATYAAFKVAGADLRRLIQRLQKLGDGRVAIDEASAALFAVELAATPDTFNDVEITSTAKLRGPFDEEYDTPKGFIVGLLVNGSPIQVVVGVDGSVAGSAAGLPAEMMAPLGLDRPPVRPRLSNNTE